MIFLMPRPSPAFPSGKRRAPDKGQAGRSVLPENEGEAEFVPDFLEALTGDSPSLLQKTWTA